MKKFFIFFIPFFFFSNFKGYSQGTTCQTATPFCTAVGTPFTYANSTTGDLGSLRCLQTTPGPNWFYVKTTTPGTYVFDIKQSTTSGGSPNIDVDFIAFGPYSAPQCSFGSGGGGLTNDCSSIGTPYGDVEDCSYCWDPTETMTLRPTSNCLIYMVLVTNYSRTAGFITFTQTSGPATDCNITSSPSWTAPDTTCVDGPLINLNSLLNTGTATGGTWSGTGVSGSNFSPANAGVGTHNITYTLTGVCTSLESHTITVLNSNTTPTFTALGPYCVGEIPGILPTTSTNGIIGTWNPSSISTSSIGTTNYTFTPTNNICAINTSINVSVTSSITPIFTALGPYCVGAVPANLPSTSSNGVVGNWNPSTISTSSPGIIVYTFNPTNSLCAVTTNMSVTISTQIIPNFSSINAFCAGSISPVLASTSPNGITGVWNPATISNTNTGTYTFTPNAGQCSPPQTLNVTVNSSPNVIASASPSYLCEGSSSTLTASGATSYNWSGGLGTGSSVIATPTITTTYIVTGSENGCPDTASITVVVFSILDVNITSQNASCGQSDGSATVELPAGNYTFIWNTSPIQTTQTATNLAVGTYTVTVTNNGCPVTSSVTIAYNIGPDASFVASPTVLTIGEGEVIFNDNSTGNIAQSIWYFGDGSYTNGLNTLHNYNDTGTYLVTHIVIGIDGCVDTAYGYIHIISDFNLYIPNSFSPNNDFSNDVFLPKGNGVDVNTYSMSIYNRWGQCIFETSNFEEGWNGTYKNQGKYEKAVQGVYVYNISLKDINHQRHEYVGSVTLLH